MAKYRVRFSETVEYEVEFEGDAEVVNAQAGGWYNELVRANPDYRTYSSYSCSGEPELLSFTEIKDKD